MTKAANAYRERIRTAASGRYTSENIETIVVAESIEDATWIGT